MTCPPIYHLLDASAPSSERHQAAAHLDACAACRGRRARLAAFEDRLTRALTTRAGLVEPSPRAWSRLRATLAAGARPASPRLPRRPGPVPPDRLTLRGDQPMQRKLAAAALGLAVLVAGIAAAAPTVAAQVGDTVDFIIRIGDDGKVGGIAPGYLPPGFAERPIVIGLSQNGPGQAPQIGASRLYRDGERFVYIVKQTPAGGDLPAGVRLAVGSAPAVLEENVSGSVPSGPVQPGVRVPIAAPIGATPLAAANPPAPMPAEPQPLTYADARRLSWFIGSGANRTKVEILSNLPESEIVKIAEALKLH